MDDLEFWHPLALHLACRRLLYCGRDECNGRRRVVYLVSGDAVDRGCANPGKRHEHSCVVAGTVDLCGRSARGPATRSAAGCLCGFGPGRGERSGGAPEHPAGYVFAYRTLAAAGRFPAVLDQRTCIAMAARAVG